MTDDNKTPEVEPEGTTDEQKPDKLDEFFKRNKWAFPTALGVLGVIAVLLVLFFSGVLGGGDEEPTPAETPTSSSSEAPGDWNQESDNGEAQPPAASQPAEEPQEETESAEPADASNQEIAAVASSFVSQVNNTSDNTSLAKGVDGIAARPLVESLKVSSYDVIPKGGKLEGSPSSNEEGLWTVGVVDEEGETLYELTLGSEKANGKDNIRVLYMDVREVVTDDKPRLDERGYPLPQSVYPLSPGQADSIKSTAWGVVKTYGEYDGGDKKEDREKQVEGAVHGGSHPPLKEYSVGGAEQIRLYQPEEFEMLTGVGKDGSKDGVISVRIKVAYGNDAALEPVPIETMNLIVDLKWNNDLQMWQAVELRNA